MLLGKETLGNIIKNNLLFSTPSGLREETGCIFKNTCMRLEAAAGHLV